MAHLKHSSYVVCLALLATQNTAAPAREPLDFLPAETLLCWSADRLPDTNVSASQPSLASWIDLGSRLTGHPLKGRALITLRLAEAFSHIAAYPHAIAAIDARAAPTKSGGRRVDRLKLALIVKTGGESETFRRMIQRIINEQVDTSTATLSERKALRWTYQELYDERLPRWARIAWGDIGGHFVVTLGQDVWPRIAAVAAQKAPSLSRDDWIAETRSKMGGSALIEIIASIRGIRERLDPFVDGRATDFFQAWDAADAERGYWALGFKKNALFCANRLRGGGRNGGRLLADPDTTTPHLLATIPAEARYAIYDVAPADFFPRLLNSIVATRGASTRAAMREFWSGLESQQQINCRRDILDNLGPHIVMHNAPPHPLHIPLAMTMLYEIKSNPGRVRDTIEKLSQGLQAALQRAAEAQDNPAALAIRRSSDGVWYLQFGLTGPAWTVTDKFIITSWSPVALRAYLQRVGDAAGSRTQH